MVYYNDNNPDVAAWLHELIKAGLLPDGVVDTRSITEIKANELTEYTQCHFFAGIGGWAYALRLAGWADERPVWTGSCPCQPFSAIGKRRGTADERHLWPVWFDLIRQCRPSVVFGEQVASADALGWLDGVFDDLEAEDYACGASDLCAAGVGAPHIRQRLYWVGYAQREGLEGHGGNGDPAGGPEADRPDAAPSCAFPHSPRLDALPVLRGLDLHDPWGTRGGLRLPPDRRVGDQPLRAGFEALPCADGWRRIQPGLEPLAHGVPARVVRLCGYGNAIVPPLAAEFIRAAEEARGGIRNRMNIFTP